MCVLALSILLVVISPAPPMLAAPAPVPEDMRTRERYGPVTALGKAVGKTWDMSALTVRLLWNVATGDVSARNLSGPINIAEYAGFSARQGILAFLSFLSIVSVSLFVLNLLPIPVLDGGHITLAMIEGIRRRLRLTTLKYQRLEDLVAAIGLPKEKLCTHCWDGSSYF